MFRDWIEAAVREVLIAAHGNASKHFAMADFLVGHDDDLDLSPEMARGPACYSEPLILKISSRISFKISAGL
jgi:hypothetical protein